MDNSLNEEEVERIRESHPFNTREHLTRVRRLLQYAEPGNLPWKILENEYGFMPDYQPEDAGMHQSDNEEQEYED